MCSIDSHRLAEQGTTLRAASILDDGSGTAARLLAEAAAGLSAQGRRVHGLLMARLDDPAQCASTMVLTDVWTRDAYVVSQALGPQSESCCADPQGFAEASSVLRRALQAAPDIVVVNRFGALEVAGGGFRSEFLEILSQDVPLLTVVAARHRAAWHEFTGGASVLPPDAATIAAWLERNLST